MVEGNLEVPQLALLGSGIFVRTQYIPRLREITHLVSLKVLWSRSEKSAKVAAALAQDFSPNIDVKWGEAGLDEIIQDKSINGVAVVLAAQAQVEISMKILRAGKHVLQEKPAASSIKEAAASLSFYRSLSVNGVCAPIWAIAENYRFEPALLEAAKLVKELGDLMNFQVTAEAPMNSLNPYFSSEWRRNFNISFRVVGSKGTVEAERFSKDGQHGYTVSYYPLTGDPQVSFYPFSGVNEELKAFVNDMVKATSEDKDVSGPDYRSSLVEGTRDVAVIEAMLQSSAKQGSPVVVEHML